MGPSTAVAFAGHSAKGDASVKEAIDRIRGSGVFARDPDSLVTFTKHGFGNFHEYCRSKWAYGRNYVDGRTSAAQVFTQLMTNSHQNLSARARFGRSSALRPNKPKSPGTPPSKELLEQDHGKQGALA